MVTGVRGRRGIDQTIDTFRFLVYPALRKGGSMKILTSSILCAVTMLGMHAQAAYAQSGYFARVKIPVPQSATGASTAPPALKCAMGDHTTWTYLKIPGTRPGYVVDPSVLTKVATVKDRSQTQTTACENAIKGTGRRQCIVTGQGGFDLDMYVTKVDGVFPSEVIERDNAIVYEVLSCS